ncbi:MAG TPA: SDR family NAD(P)-dependent oxidoreductase [Myxococcales bacterium]
MNSPDFKRRYGPWAVVAGASEGLGAAYADALASRGLNLVLLARRAAVLDSLAGSLRGRHGLEVRTLAVDLAAGDFAERLEAAVAGLEVGLGVYNAAFSPIGAFLDVPLADQLQAVAVNCRGPVIFGHVLGGPMAARGRGGLVLMSSLAGLQGTAALATYSASKAFNVTLGEALWQELRGQGVDVLASCAGAILTPGFQKASSRPAPGTLPPEEVARITLAALGQGPTVVPGAVNRLASLVLGRVLPRRLAIRLMASTTAKVVPAPARPRTG